MTGAKTDAEWPRTRLRYQARLNPTVRPDIRSTPAAEVTFLAMESIGDDGSIQRDAARPVSELLTGYSYFENNDVLLAKVTPCFENGKGALVTGLPRNAGFGTTEVTVLRPERTLVPQYLFYLTSEDRFKQGGIAAMTGAGGLKRVPDAYIRNFELALPAVEEQQRIADYLDVHTAKIDALIGKQERLIETLGERRQAVISHAVTKGLDPNAPMKETGVGWIGAIPTTWKVSRVKHFGRLLTGSTPSTEVPGHFDADSGTPWIRPQDINSSVRGSSGSLFLSTSGRQSASIVKPGSVLVCCIGAGSIGKVGYTYVECTTNQQISAIESPECGEYVYLLLSAATDEIMASSAINRLPIINNSRLGAIAVPVPPVNEQREIVRYVDRETAKIDALSAKAREMIDVLKERRQALISAAVTGKIDVRGLA